MQAILLAKPSCGSDKALKNSQIAKKIIKKKVQINYCYKQKHFILLPWSGKNTKTCVVFSSVEANRWLSVAHWNFKSKDTQKLCFYYISALLTISQMWQWQRTRSVLRLIVAKVWGFRGSLRTRSCFEDLSKRRNGTEKHRKAEFSQDFHAPFPCKICVLSIRHGSQGDQRFFFPLLSLMLLW